MSLELRPASSLSLAERTDLFNAGYEGYVIPMRLTSNALTWMVDMFDIDLDASQIALRDGGPVGFANLAIRDDEAWVGGVGVVQQERRRGTARTLMRALHDEARARGVRRIWLEVIEQNDGAYRLYDELGYEVVRPLEVWSLPQEAHETDARQATVEDAHARIRALRTTREPWQRADATLANVADAQGLETEGGAAVFRPGGAVQVIQIAGAAHALLQAIRADGNVVLLNVQPDDPVVSAFRELGGSATVRQREMVLAL